MAAGKYVDLHDRLKQSMLRDLRLEQKDEVGIADHYFMLDSFNKDRSSRTDLGEFKWAISYQGVTREGFVGISDKPESIIEVEVYDFSMPIIIEQTDAATFSTFVVETVANNLDILPVKTQYPPELFQDNEVGTTFVAPWIHNPVSQIPYDGRMVMQIKELGLQGFDMKSAKHQFEMQMRYTASMNGTSPRQLQVKTDKIFQLTDPLREMSAITLNFRNPDHPISFQPDCLYSVPMTFILYNTKYYPKFTYFGHSLLHGDRVFITGCDTKTRELDAYINRNRGHLVTKSIESGDTILPGMPIEDETYFGLSSSPGLPATIPGTFYVDIYIARRRLRIPIRMRGLLSKGANFKKP